MAKKPAKPAKAKKPAKPSAKPAKKAKPTKPAKKDNKKKKPAKSVSKPKKQLKPVKKSVAPKAKKPSKTVKPAKAEKKVKPTKPAKATKIVAAKPAKSLKPVKPEKVLKQDKPVKKPEPVEAKIEKKTVTPPPVTPAAKPEARPVRKSSSVDDDFEIQNVSISISGQAQRTAGPPPPWKPIENLHIYVPSHLDEINKQEILKKVNIRTEPLKGNTVEEKLRALYDLQLIDSRIDRIHAVRGELPLEVQDLEDDVAGLETRIKNLNSELEQIQNDINIKKGATKESEALIKKYKTQQGNVRNNREFESLSKEIEFQELEIQLHKKKVKDLEAQIVSKEEMISAAELKLKERKQDLKLKKTELDNIVKETEREEKILLAKSKEARKVIEDRLIQAYQRIREASRNGLAVVPIEREASAGSFIQIPPQKQMDVAARKKIIVDEHSGRILVDSELALEEQAYIASILAKELK